MLSGNSGQPAGTGLPIAAAKAPMSRRWASSMSSVAGRIRNSCLIDRLLLGAPPSPRIVDRSSGPHQPGDRRRRLGQLLVGLLAALGDGVADAVAEVLVEQPERHRLQRAVDGADLGQHVNAVLVLVDHPGDAAHLALDAPQSLGVVLLVRRVAVPFNSGLSVWLGHGWVPNIVFICSISACCASMMVCANDLASTFCPLAS